MKPRIVTSSLAIATSALLLAVGLAGCSPAAPAEEPIGPGDDAGSAPSGADLDACELVSIDLLTDVLAMDPGQGASSEGNIGGSQCEFDPSDRVSVLVQVTPDADTYFPEAMYPAPAGAQEIAGIDRGYVDEETRTILIVEGGTGLMLTVIAVGDGGDMSALPALADDLAESL